MGFLNRKQKEEPKEEKRCLADIFQLNSELEFIYPNSKNSAMRISVVNKGVSNISNTIAGLPIRLYQEKDNNIKEITDDRRLYLLNDRPNEGSNGYLLKKGLVENNIFNGKSLIYINGSKMNPESIKDLYLVENYQNNKDIVNGIIQGSKYNFTLNNYSFSNIEMTKVIEFKTGNEGLLKYGKDIFDRTQATENYLKRFMERALINNVVYEIPSENALDEEELSEVKNKLKQAQHGDNNSFDPVVLNGMTVKELRLYTPKDVGVTDIDYKLIRDVENMLNYPIGYLNDKYNLETNEKSLQFLKETVRPWIENIEQSLTNQLLTTKEIKDGYYFRFDISELLRTSFTDLIMALKEAYNNGLLSRNECRYYLDKEGLEVDVFKDSMGSVSTNAETGESINQNTGDVLNGENQKIDEKNKDVDKKVEE